MTSGALDGQVRLITAFDPINDELTVAPAFSASTNGLTYEIIPAGGVDIREWLGAPVNALVSGAVDADVSALQSAAVNAIRDALRTDAVTSLISDAGPAAGDFDGDSGLSASNDFYNGSVLVFTGGALAGIARRISDYVGASRNIQFNGTGSDADAPFPTAPADTDPFLIVGRIGA